MPESQIPVAASASSTTSPPNAQPTSPRNNVVANGDHSGPPTIADLANSARGNGGSKALDAQRARQILDRAFMLSERGDFAGAIVACRQSIALSPRDSSAHSMLGFLLERAGDFTGAMRSYSATLELAPDSPLERDSLRRLQVQYGTTAQTNSPVDGQSFQFNGAELYGDTVANNPKQVVATPAPSVSTSNHVAAAPVAATNSVPVAVAQSVNTPVSQVAVNRAPAPVAPVPVRVAPAVVTTTVAPVAPASNTSVAPLTNSPLSWWAALDVYPTFWTRSLPLMAVAGTGLLWMLWAHNAAAPRVANVSTTTTSTLVESEAAATNSAIATDSTTNSAVAASNVANATANGAAPGAGPNAAPGTAPAAAPGATPTPDPNGLFSSSWVITNKPQRAMPTPATITNSSNSNTTRPRENEGRRANRAVTSERPVQRASQRPAQTRPRYADPAAQPLPPAAPSTLPPAPVSELPRVEQRPATSSVPRNTAPGVSPDQMPPTNEDDGGNGGIRPYEGAVPEFPNPTTSSQPSIQPSSAAPVIQQSSLNSRNNSAAETAYRYQMRALLYLERGDDARANADFNNAISFYQRQISTGIGVADARRGLEACRKGLTLVKPR